MKNRKIIALVSLILLITNYNNALAKNSTSKKINTQNIKKDTDKDEELNKAFYDAIQTKDINTVKNLIAKGVKINQKRALNPEFQDLYTPLMASIISKNIYISKLLIEKGADISQVDSKGTSILSLALNNRLNSLVPLLITDKNKLDIHYYSEINDYKKIKSLLDEGININLKDKFGNTPLIIASEKGNKEVVELLLDSGADTNLMNNYNYTALDNIILSLEEGNQSKISEKEEIINLLLSKGALFKNRNRASDKLYVEKKELKNTNFKNIIYFLK